MDENMSTLDDFYGDSKTATKECSYCGKGEEVEALVVSVSDAYGPTHWHHAACKAESDAKRKPATLRPTWDESVDEAQD